MIFFKEIERRFNNAVQVEVLIIRGLMILKRVVFFSCTQMYLIVIESYYIPNIN